jgi:large subunit ribosomal protein L22
VDEALTILQHTPRRSAIQVSKVVKSARANAENNHNYRPNSLHITEISVTQGPRLKRFRAVSRGMAHPYVRRTSHIRVQVEGEKRQPKKSPAKSESSSAQEKKA